MDSIKYLDVFVYSYVFISIKYSGCISPSFKRLKKSFVASQTLKVQDYMLRNYNSCSM